ncbi:hypothetical protein HBH64_088300 [Parastagonospora nodorum]|nr:hypothetical protein HBI01_149810 [Parastagonospora nodorum]KAH4304759.1 hypothetical protein HBI02_125010 [Parastagonospora nodorum]KAH4323861.1 hypothetical protein HBI00_179780 [Parastagonospora nodorum]KAH4367785.1 hypothetical protein HBH94_137970 [Parastagonospora nodorum]KAH4462662.1 hypothetical protein HBH90_130610 [Parastagonospora nodorum]
MEFKDPTASLLLTEDSINPQTNRLPAIEALPTDLLQQISEDLIYTCHRKADPKTLTYEFIYPNGICQLRASSKTLRANSERAFARCFRLTSVQFNGTGLSRLVELSLSDKYASLLRIIIFHPAADSQTIATAKTTPLEAGGENMAKLRHYVTEHAPETTFMIFALARLKGLYSVIIGPMFQRLYPASVRQRSLARHPSSMILPAIIASRVPLKHMLMWDQTPELFHGVKPRIMDNLRYHTGCFKNLTTLTLMLTSRNVGAKSGDGLYRFLNHATNLQVLFLALDKASIDGIAPSSSSPSVLL